MVYWYIVIVNRIFYHSFTSKLITYQQGRLFFLLLLFVFTDFVTELVRAVSLIKAMTALKPSSAFVIVITLV